MKKMFSKLIVLALGITALSGCDLFSFGGVTTNKGDEEHEVKGLSLKDYSLNAVQDSNYKFDGKVFLTYEDASVPELEVTENCTYSTLDTSTVGDHPFKVSYEGSKYIYSKTVYIRVKEKVVLKSIEIEGDYYSTIKKGHEFAFIGSVIANYSDGTKENVTSYVTVDKSALNINQAGTYPVHISFTKDGITKSTSIDVKVIELLNIEVKNYETSVKKDGVYTFGGTIIANYSDHSVENVTSLANVDLSKVDTSTVGKYRVDISFTDAQTTVSTFYEVDVYVDRAKLVKIVASGYTTEVEKGHDYTFDGVVTATFEDNTTEIVTSNCTYTAVSTISTGAKNLTISYSTFYTVNGKEYSISKTTTASINVISKITGLSGEALTIGVGRAKSINLTYSPSDTTEKEVTYTSSNPAVATVDANGKVTGKSVGNTTIVVTSKANNTVTTSVDIEVAQVVLDEWTILLYLCGSNLESGYASSNQGEATIDLQEIASVSGQPEDVNIVVQAGGSNAWSSTYSSVISASKTNRFHLKNQTYVKDSQTDKSNMGSQSTLQSFVKWGLETYPSEKVGLILWNHGGAMGGCCQDEQFNDMLTPAETDAAIRNAREAVGLTDKFEFVGYDCCLMQVQDIAGLASKYAKYHIGSEESEWGYGWSYDKWIDDLFAKKTTENILKANVDGFYSDTQSAYSSWGESNDQTLSYLNLAYWDEYEVAWENMATTLSGIITSSSKWSTFKSLLNSCQRFGRDGSAYPFDVFDAGHFFKKIKTNNNYSGNATLMSQINTLEGIYSNLVVYEKHGSGSSNASGLTLFAPISGYSARSDYSENSTPFTVWRQLCLNYGSWWY